MQLMLALVLVPIMIEACGAWISLASSPKVAARVEPRSGYRRSGRSFNRGRRDPSGTCFSLLMLQNEADGIPLGGAAKDAPSTAEQAVPGENGYTQGGSEGGQSSNISTSTSTSSDLDDGDVVRAVLEKPVGLVLAEKAIGQPGLVVDDMVDGGSAKESGIVVRGMTLLSACGVDCGALLFDQVAEMLQSSPPEAPIEFVFSSTTESAPP